MRRRGAPLLRRLPCRGLRAGVPLARPLLAFNLPSTVDCWPPAVTVPRRLSHPALHIPSRRWNRFTSGWTSCCSPASAYRNDGPALEHGRKTARYAAPVPVGHNGVLRVCGEGRLRGFPGHRGDGGTPQHPLQHSRWRAQGIAAIRERLERAGVRVEVAEGVITHNDKPRTAAAVPQGDHAALVAQAAKTYLDWWLLTQVGSTSSSTADGGTGSTRCVHHL